ncbi:MAG: metallophosphoesterase, partial [Bacteroidales bacterium]
MEISKRVLSVFLMMWFASVLISCKKSDPVVPADLTINPFSNGGNDRNMIVVISDMHLGADLTYAECNLNLTALEKLIIQIKVAPNVKELVIAGDLMDEWFVPATVNTFEGSTQADFAHRIATANAEVFSALNSIIQEGKILVTYLPGNHDLVITAADIESVLPGINQ